MFKFKCNNDNCEKIVSSIDGNIQKNCPECEIGTLYMLPVENEIAKRINDYSKQNFYKKFILIKLQGEEVQYILISEEKFRIKRDIYKKIPGVTFKEVGCFNDINLAKTYVEINWKINNDKIITQ